MELKKKGWHWTASVLVAAGLVAAPAVSTSAQTLVVAGVTTPKGVDGDVFLPGTLESVMNMYEGLTKYGRRTVNGVEELDASQIHGHLAKSWTVSADGTVYDFTLEEAGSPFGNTLTADDVVWGWDKSTAQGRTGNFLKNVSNVVNVEAVSPRVVRFTLAAPNRAFIRVLQLYAPGIYDSKVTKEHATSEDPWALEWISKNSAGYGAYHLDSIRPGEGAVFNANPNYFDTAPHFKRVVFREVPSPANRVALIKSGQAQWAEQIPVQQIVELQKDPNVKVQSVVGTGSALLQMNLKFKPFDDVRVRRAFAYATDYKAINEAVFLGLGTRSRSFMPPVLEGHTPAYQYDRDITKAKALLSEAGYPNGVDVTLEYSDNWWWEESLAIQMKDSLADADIRVALKRIPSTDMNTRRSVFSGNQIAFFTHLTTPFVLEPGYAFLLSAHAKGSNNVGAYFKPEMDALVDKMLVERDDEKWLEMVREAQRMHAEDAPFIDTFLTGVHAVMAPCITGWVWRPAPFNIWRDLKCES